MLLNIQLFLIRIGCSRTEIAGVRPSRRDDGPRHRGRRESCKPALASRCCRDRFSCPDGSASRQSRRRTVAVRESGSGRPPPRRFSSDAGLYDCGCGGANCNSSRFWELNRNSHPTGGGRTRNQPATRLGRVPENERARELTATDLVTLWSRFGHVTFDPISICVVNYCFYYIIR